MDSFLGIGIWEILLVFVLAMIFVGPKKLPEIAAKLGRAYRRLKNASHDLTSELTKEVNINSDQKIENPLRKVASDLNSEFSGLKNNLAVKVDSAKRTDSKPQGQVKEPDVQP